MTRWLLKTFQLKMAVASLGMVVSSAALNRQSVHKLVEKLKK